MKQTRRTKLTSIGFSLLFALALAGCNRQEAEPAKTPAPAPSVQASAKVTEVNLGRSLTPEQAIGDRTDVFSPTDTIYASVKTQGTGSPAVLEARWTYQDGQVIKMDRQTLAPTQGAAVSEFHVSKPDGWPTGQYKVEILLDGKLTETREFKVS